jgi:hypothetical protein
MLGATRLAALTLSSLLLLGGGAHAAPMTFTFGGVVTFVDLSAPFDASVAIGAAVAGAYTFDTDTPDTAPQTTLGFYPHSPPSGSFTATFGSYQLESTTFSEISIRVSRDDPTDPIQVFDSYSAGADLLRISGLPCNESCPSASMFLIFLAPAGTNADVRISTRPPSLSVWQGEFLIRLHRETAEPVTAIRGRVLSIVPEPSPLGPLLAALCALAGIARVRGQDPDGTERSYRSVSGRGPRV